MRRFHLYPTPCIFWGKVRNTGLWRDVTDDALCSHISSADMPSRRCRYCSAWKRTKTNDRSTILAYSENPVRSSLCRCYHHWVVEQHHHHHLCVWSIEASRIQHYHPWGQCGTARLGIEHVEHEKILNTYQKLRMWLQGLQMHISSHVPLDRIDSMYVDTISSVWLRAFRAGVVLHWSFGIFPVDTSTIGWALILGYVPDIAEIVVEILPA